MDEKAFQAAIEVFERVSCDTTDPTCGEALKAAITAYEQARERVAVPTLTADVLAALPGARFYSIDTEYQVETHDTAEKARELAESELECDGKWAEGTDGVEWGVLVPVQEVRKFDLVEPDADSDDERAQMAAANGWAYHCSYKLVDTLPLRPVPTTERVAVPSREEIAAGLSTAYQASELNADEALEFDDIPEAERQRHLWMADYVLTLLRQAPSERVAVPTMPDLVTLEKDWLQRREQGPKGVAVWATEQIAPHARSATYWMDNAKRFEAELAKLKAEAQRPAPSAQPWTRELCQKVYASFVPHSRHTADSEYLYQAGVVHFGPTAPVASAQGGAFTDRGEPGVAWSVLERWKTDFYAQLGRADSLERDLAAERAAHQATKADCERRLNDWQDTHEQEVEQLKDDLATERAECERLRAKVAEQSKYLIDADWADYTNDQIRIAAAEKRAAELEQDRDNWRDQYQDGAKVLRGRIAELERERDEARAKLEALIASVVAVTREAPNVNSAWLAGEIRKLCTSALARESAKPAEPSAAQSHVEFSASAPAAVQRIMVDGYEKAVKPAEPKPGDVLSGEAAKAYMLANPGRRVCDTKATTLVYRARDGEIGLECSDGMLQTECIAFTEGEYYGWTFRVLPPEPAKPATPDLDLAGRVGRLEAAREVLTQFMAHVALGGNRVKAEDISHAAQLVYNKLDKLRPNVDGDPQ